MQHVEKDALCREASKLNVEMVKLFKREFPFICGSYALQMICFSEKRPHPMLVKTPPLASKCLIEWIPLELGIIPILQYFIFYLPRSSWPSSLCSPLFIYQVKPSSGPTNCFVTSFVLILVLEWKLYDNYVFLFWYTLNVSNILKFSWSMTLAII